MTLIATGFGSTTEGGAAQPASAASPQPAAGGAQAAPAPLPGREASGIEIPAFLRKRRDRGK